MKGSFVMDQPDGKWEYYYYTGDLEKITHYKDGKLDGEYIYYFDNGEVNVKGRFEAGQKSGEWTWFTNSGVVDMKGNFKTTCNMVLGFIIIHQENFLIEQNTKRERRMENGLITIKTGKNLK